MKIQNKIKKFKQMKETNKKQKRVQISNKFTYKKGWYMCNQYKKLWLILFTDIRNAVELINKIVFTWVIFEVPTYGY